MCDTFSPWNMGQQLPRSPGVKLGRVGKLVDTEIRQPIRALLPVKDKCPHENQLKKFIRLRRGSE